MTPTSAVAPVVASAAAPRRRQRRGLRTALSMTLQVALDDLTDIEPSLIPPYDTLLAALDEALAT